MTRTSSLRSVLALGAVLLAMLALAPAGFAGEDDPVPPPTTPTEPTPTTPEPTPPPPPPAPAPTPPPPPAKAPAPAKPAPVSKPAPAKPKSQSTSGGSSDTGKAKGGVQAGFGGMTASDPASFVLPISLAGGALVVLTAAGAVSRRRVLER